MLSTAHYYETLEQVLFEPNKNYVIFVAQKSKECYEKLQQLNINFHGAIFPQIFFENQNYEQGFLVYELKDDAQAFIIENITYNIDDEVEEILSDKKTILLIVDGLSSHIETFLEEFYEYCSDDCTILGGGAGSLTLMQEPVIFNNYGIFQNAALIISHENKSNCGVKHGWEKLKGPYVVTDAQRNVLKSIDYKNAFSVYKEVVENDSNMQFNETNFFDLAKSYPIGIEKYGSEIIVRDPIILENDHLVLVGEIDKNSVIYILKGNKDNLIQAAKNASNDIKNDESNNLFGIDCISRVLFLEERFVDELKAISSSHKEKTLSGILTLGEIANNHEKFIEFYNKTCVVGLI